MAGGDAKVQHGNNKRKREQVDKPKKAKDPNKPKRPPTAYLEFMAEFRVSYKEKHPDSKGVSEASKAGGLAWKEMNAEEKAPYITKATEKKALHMDAMEAYKKKRGEDGGSGSSKPEASDSGESGAKVAEKKHKRRKRDPSKPKRSLSAFMEFMVDFRKTYKENHPDSRRVVDAAKAGGLRWKEMTSDEKAPYVLRASEKKNLGLINDTVEKEGEADERKADTAESEGNGDEMNAGEGEDVEDDEEDMQT